jgi:hypothetical protein
MTGWRSGALAAALCVLLVGCSQGATDGKSAASGSGPSSSVPAATLAKTCLAVQKAIVTLGADPKAPALDSTRKQVVALSAAGDAETKKVLAGVVAALAAYRDAHPGQQTLDAKSALAGSLGGFSSRCQALGAFTSQ